MTIEVVYNTKSGATGGGRDGHVESADGRIDLDTRPGNIDNNADVGVAAKV